MNKKRLSINLKRIFSNGAFVFILALGIEAFTFKIPYCVVVGMFLILISLVFFPGLDKICNLIGVKLNGKNKCFIIILNLFIAAYSIKPEEKSYYKCILPIVLMVFVWITTLIYSKQKIKN